MVGDKKAFRLSTGPKGEAVLAVDGLTALHHSGGYKLNDVTFTLCKGEVIGIYGLLGAGRTELFKGLVGLMPCQNGSIHLNGENIGRAPFQARLKRAGAGTGRPTGRRRGADDVHSIQYDALRFQSSGFRRAGNG